MSSLLNFIHTHSVFCAEQLCGFSSHIYLAGVSCVYINFPRFVDLFYPFTLFPASSLLPCGVIILPLFSILISLCIALFLCMCVLYDPGENSAPLCLHVRVI